MSDEAPTYRVLARKYRPETFSDLVGQEAMVKTLRNAFAANRVAQAFMMTGIRGTGKTTTARIIAKGLNCVGTDAPTTEPCGTCEHCTAIIAGRHVDVLEMDAASRTGVGDIREIIDSVQYRAASARYKIYIIDEVHMLSTSAFNALLKTLEEPPEHVKFIFATTEIRRVPVTVLSRCQRFDLRRIEPEAMIDLLRRIATAEGATITDDALALITRAAEGSARDATSLLDQAISHGSGETTADQIRAMLGLADRGRVLDLFEAVLRGDTAAALGEIGSQYAAGADPIAILRELAEAVHWVSVAKITPNASDDPTLPPDTRARGSRLANEIPMRVLTRMWQMLLKALEEVSHAPNAMMAAEMAIIRLTHVADLPSPEDLVRKLDATPTPGPAAAPPRQPTRPAPSPSGNGPQAALAVAEVPELARYPQFEDVIGLIRANRDIKLSVEVETGVRLARYQPGRIEFTPSTSAPPDLAQRLSARLKAWTGVQWAVSVVSDCTEQTIAEQRDAGTAKLAAEAEAHPLVKAVFTHFPKAKIVNIRTTEEITQEAAAESLTEVEDEWDPFEED